jgi:hypothetical protein
MRGPSRFTNFPSPNIPSALVENVKYSLEERSEDVLLSTSPAKYPRMISSAFEYFERHNWFFFDPS